MRTTINLPDALAEEARAHARSVGRTFTSLVEEGLRVVLTTPAEPALPDPLPTYGRPDGRILIDLADRDAVWEVLESGPDA